MPPEEPPKYWCNVEDSATLTAELNLVPRGSDVLEVGTAAGHMTRALARKDCRVVGLEIDPGQAARARAFCARMVVGNIEELEVERAISERFDVVLCGDVLEHLRDPAIAVTRLKSLLRPGGFMVVSLPNVAHGSVRLSLLDGRFPYARYGLLDATHLRFFTLSGIVDLFNSAGLEIRDVHRTRIGLFDSEIPLAPEALPPDLVARLLDDPEGTSYQFVFRAVPSSQPTSLAHVQDRTFDAREQRRRFAADALERAWVAFHDTFPRPKMARTWARFAFAARPSRKAALYWVASFMAGALLRRPGRRR